MAERPGEPGAEPRALRWVAVVEHYVVLVVLVLIVLVVLQSTVEVAWLVASRLVQRPLGLEVGRLLDAFGALLLVLIGLELLVSVRAYLRDHVLHLNVVLEVALVAVARKAIVLDLEKYDGVTLLGLAALVAALGFAIYLQVRAARPPSGEPSRDGRPEPPATG